MHELLKAKSKKLNKLIMIIILFQIFVIYRVKITYSLIFLFINLYDIIK